MLSAKTGKGKSILGANSRGTEDKLREIREDFPEEEELKPGFKIRSSPGKERKKLHLGDLVCQYVLSFGSWISSRVCVRAPVCVLWKTHACTYFYMSRSQCLRILALDGRKYLKTRHRSSGLEMIQQESKGPWLWKAQDSATLDLKICDPISILTQICKSSCHVPMSFAWALYLQMNRTSQRLMEDGFIPWFHKPSSLGIFRSGISKQPSSRSRSISHR